MVATALGGGVQTEVGLIPAQDEHLVVFRIGEEDYGVDIARVWEINEVPAITRLPRTSPFIEGVINLRGEVIPVMDLRQRLGLPAREQERETRIMVVQAGSNRLGLRVDGVREVIRVAADAVEPPSPMVATVDSGYLRGIARLEERLVVLFDLDQLLNGAETVV
jgi:purine-binding chemotaxis protein CheW